MPGVDAGADTDDAEVDGADDADEKVPWHFKLMIVALVVYLGWRFVQLGIAISPDPGGWNGVGCRQAAARLISVRPVTMRPTLAV